MMDDAKKLVKIDASGKMIRSGMSLRLSGQGSGIAEKFRFVLEPAGGSLIVQDGERQVAPELRQRGRPRGAAVLRRRRAEVQGRRSQGAA